MGYAFAAIELIDSLLDRGEEFNALGDFFERCFIRQLLDRIKNEGFLRHAKNITKRMTCDQPSFDYGSAGQPSFDYGSN